MHLDLLQLRQPGVVGLLHLVIPEEVILVVSSFPLLDSDQFSNDLDLLVVKCVFH